MADLSQSNSAGAAFCTDFLKDAIPQPKIQPDKIESIVEVLDDGQVTG